MYGRFLARRTPQMPFAALPLQTLAGFFRTLRRPPSRRPPLPHSVGSRASSSRPPGGGRRGAGRAEVEVPSFPPVSLGLGHVAERGFLPGGWKSRLPSFPPVSLVPGLRSPSQAWGSSASLAYPPGGGNLGPGVRKSRSPSFPPVSLVPGHAAERWFLPGSASNGRGEQPHMGSLATHPTAREAAKLGPLRW